MAINLNHILEICVQIALPALMGASVFYHLFTRFGDCSLAHIKCASKKLIYEGIDTLPPLVNWVQLPKKYCISFCMQIQSDTIVSCYSPYLFLSALRDLSFCHHTIKLSCSVFMSLSVHSVKMQSNHLVRPLHVLSSQSQIFLCFFDITEVHDIVPLRDKVSINIDRDVHHTIMDMVVSLMDAYGYRWAITIL